jgi:hypothetical protein
VEATSNLFKETKQTKQVEATSNLFKETKQLEATIRVAKQTLRSLQ